MCLTKCDLQVGLAGGRRQQLLLIEENMEVNRSRAEPDLALVKEVT